MLKDGKIKWFLACDKSGTELHLVILILSKTCIGIWWHRVSLGLGHCILLTRIFLVEDGIPSSFTSAKSVFSRKALVKMQLLKDVAGNDTYRINNKYDEAYPPLPVEEVMQRSEYVIGQEVEYDIFVNNCEHFVTLLRYGEGISEQVSFL